MALKSVSIKGLVAVPQVNFSRLAIVQPNYYDQCAQYNSAVRSYYNSLLGFSQALFYFY